MKKKVVNQYVQNTKDSTSFGNINYILEWHLIKARCFALVFGKILKINKKTGFVEVWYLLQTIPLPLSKPAFMINFNCPAVQRQQCIARQIDACLFCILEKGKLKPFDPSF